MTTLTEIELNFSNLCGASCVFCSRPHGIGNEFLMSREVFDAFMRQLPDCKDVNIIQTSGNGETFLNPIYLDCIAELKDKFPHIPRWIYNNFSMMTKERADRIIDCRLFDKVHVRVDSMDKQIFEKCSNLNHERVFKNIEYFLSRNTDIPFVILYNDIKKYYDKCQRVLGKRPIRDHFKGEILNRAGGESDAIKKHFEKFGPLTMCNIGHCLWAEREEAMPDLDTLCPKLNIIDHVTWICPNGDVSVCCYDDRQDTFIAGNILKEHILDIWNGKKRAEIIDGIKNKKYNGKYPCTNPNCCGFGG